MKMDILYGRNTVMVRRRMLLVVLATVMTLECSLQGDLLAAEVATTESGHVENAAEASDESDFYIEDGFVTGYKGAGGVVTIPEGVTDIGDYAFSDCVNITDVIIPEGVKRIGFHAFENCNNLTSISIPTSIERIKEYAFMNCGKLTSIAIPKNVIEIGDYAFSGCNTLNISVDKKNSLYSSKDGVLYNKDQTTLICVVGERTSITIPEGVTSINAGAFCNCFELENITIPNSVNSIGEYAFANCTSLTSVIIPEGVTIIENDVFNQCVSLTSVTIPKGVTEIGSDAFFSCQSLESVMIPKGVTSIGAQAFAYCTKLNSVNIPKGVRYIYEEAFATCWKLNNVKIPSSVYLIGDEAFYDCRSLVSATISEGVEQIGARAFGSCGNLSDIIIPRTVTRIGDFAVGYIYDYEKCSNFEISCYRGTAGEEYAKTNEIEYELIDCKTHSFGEWETITPATCRKEGEKQRKCKVCGETEKRSITKLEHTYKKNRTVVATSKRKGYTIYKCFGCGCKEKRNYTTYIGKAKITGIINKNYTGKQIKQSINVTYDNSALKNGSDYSVSYKNNKKVGKATVIITGKGKYSGSISKTFKILPRKK